MSQVAFQLHADEQFTPAQSRFYAWREHWGNDCVGLVVVIAVVILFGHRLLGPQVSVPGQIAYTLPPWSAISQPKINNEVLSDAIFSVYPNRHFVNTELQHGRLPLWNPYRETGKSVASDANQSLFYPTTILLSWLSTGHALDIEIFLHLLSAAVGMYVLVRIWGGQPPGAVVAAIAFIGCGIMTVWQQYGAVFTISAWLPWLMICYLLAERGNRFLWLGLGGGVMGLIFLANVIEWAIYDVLFLGCYALVLSIPHLWRKDWRRGARPLVDVAVLCAIGSAIGAIQILPFIEGALHAPRAGTTGYAYISNFTELPWQLVTLLAPNFFGTPAVHASYWDAGTGAGVAFYPEYAIFFGFFPVVIALLAPLWRRTLLVWFLWVFALVMATSVIYQSPTVHLLGYLPAFNAFKPTRMSYLLCFAGALLCGLVFDALFTDRHRWRPVLAVGGTALVGQDILLFALNHYRNALPKVSTPTWESIRWVALIAMGGVLALAIAMLPWWLARVVAQGALVLLIIADIAHFSIPYNAGTIDERKVLPVSTVVAALPQSVAPPRVVAIQGPNSAALLTPNTLSVYGVSDLSTIGSLMPVSYLDYIGHIDHQDLTNATTIVVHDATSPLLDLASAEYFFSVTPLDTIGKRLQLITAAQGVYLYRNLQAAPRAFVVTNVKPVPRQEDVWGTIGTPDFTPCSVATIETTSAVPLSSAQPGCTGSATITSYEPNHVTIHAETPTDGLLVLTDAYDPGWRVTVDGKAQPIYKTDDEFRGVHLSVGAHEVRFVYRPSAVLWGGAISGVGTLCAMSLIVVGIRRRTREKPAASAA